MTLPNVIIQLAGCHHRYMLSCEYTCEAKALLKIIHKYFASWPLHALSDSIHPR